MEVKIAAWRKAVFGQQGKKDDKKDRYPNHPLQFGYGAHPFYKFHF